MNASALALLLFLPGAALAQGYAGLADAEGGFAPVTAPAALAFPRDHGPHPDFRVEWWYLTANLTGADGADYGVQWTLFRSAMAPGADAPGWANGQVWMAHAAATGAGEHRFAETFARGGVGQAGVEAAPFRAWIDDWSMTATGAPGDATGRAAAHRRRRRLRLRPDARRRPPAGAAGRGRLQPEVGGRAGLLLLQPAVLHGARHAEPRRPRRRGDRAGMARPRVVERAADRGAGGLGLVRAAPRRAGRS